MPGALDGIRILEIAGIGPGPFAGMMLADHGADVIRIDRPKSTPSPTDILSRSRRNIGLDLKHPDGIAILRDLARKSDGLIEGFRPGVMERLGIGPDVLLADNPRLVYGRMTGWGQTGPLANTAGHDINYIAIAGALHAFGRAGDKPTPPINMVADFGGGGMLLAFGMVAALLHVQRTGQGQVIDAAMVDGAALLMSMVWGFRAAAYWQDERGVNLLDSGAHFYDTYETADGKYLAIGAIQPQFYAQFRKVTGLESDGSFDAQMDASTWPNLKQKLAGILRTKTRDDWMMLFEGTDCCVAPVLSMTEAPHHAHNALRKTFVESNGVTQPTPAPRFSATPSVPPAPHPGHTDTRDILTDLGYTPDRIDALTSARVLT
jgi:alpha-methylacyl-CoA racemase